MSGHHIRHGRPMEQRISAGKGAGPQKTKRPKARNDFPPALKKMRKKYLQTDTTDLKTPVAETNRSPTAVVKRASTKSESLGKRDSGKLVKTPRPQSKPPYSPKDAVQPSSQPLSQPSPKTLIPQYTFVLSVDRIVTAYQRTLLFAKMVLEEDGDKSSQEPSSMAKEANAPFLQWLRNRKFWNQKLEFVLTKHGGRDFCFRKTQDVLSSLSGEMMTKIHACLQPGQEVRFSRAMKWFVDRGFQLDMHKCHAYVVTGPVITSFEYLTPKTHEQRRISTWSQIHRMRAVFTECIDDVRVLLAALACTRDEAVTKELNILGRCPKKIAKYFPSSVEDEPQKCPGSDIFERIIACLEGVFQTPHFSMLGSHIARREYESGNKSYRPFGQKLFRLATRRGGRSCDTQRPLLLVQAVARSCLEGLREPSKAEAALYSRVMVRQMRNAFVQEALIDSSVLGIVLQPCV